MDAVPLINTVQERTSPEVPVLCESAELELWCTQKIRTPNPTRTSREAIPQYIYTMARTVLGSIRIHWLSKHEWFYSYLRLVAEEAFVRSRMLKERRRKLKIESCVQWRVRRDIVVFLIYYISSTCRSTELVTFLPRTSIFYEASTTA